MFFSLFSVLLFSCTRSTGEYSGYCNFSDGQYGPYASIDFELGRSWSGALGGAGRISFPELGLFDLSVQSERAGNITTITMFFADEGDEYDLIFTGEWDAKELEGSCELYVPAADYPVLGEGELEKLGF